MQNRYEESDFLILYYPAFQGVLGFRIMGIQNKSFENWSYGPVPISFVDNSQVTHEVGVIPSSFVTTHYELPNNLPGLATTTNYQTDIFFQPNPNLLYDFMVDYNNVLLRNYFEIPYIAPAASAYETSFTAPGALSPNASDFGFTAGPFRIISQPNMRIGILTDNQTNRNLRTNIFVNLSVYQVGLVASGPLLYDMITKQGDARNTQFFTVGGSRWGSDYTPFSAYGLERAPIPTLDLLNVGRTGAQSVVDQYLTMKKGVNYLKPGMPIPRSR